jgi:hypothetical protein
LTSSSDSSAATDTTSAEKISEQMTVIWIVVAVVVAAAAVVGWLFSRRGSQQKVDPLTEVVVDALAADWASAVSADIESVRAAVLSGEPARIRTGLARLVAEVMVTFEWDGAKTARTVVRCEYAAGAVTTVTLEVPWENVPQDVRADFLRSGDKTRSSRWAFPAS